MKNEAPLSPESEAQGSKYADLLLRKATHRTLSYTG